MFEEIYFGCRALRLASVSNIEEMQLGYSVDGRGNDLTGDSEGDWQMSWIVIGYDADLGDPFFVDTLEEGFPVYTAMHGTGSWQAVLVSSSMSTFISALKYLVEICKQKFAQIYPDNTTITAPEKLQEIERRLLEISGEKIYWPDFITEHRNWLASANS